MSSIIEVVYHEKICNVMFTLINKIFMNEDSPKFVKPRTSKTKIPKTIDQITDQHLLKDEQQQQQQQQFQSISQPLLIEEIEESERCFSFKKAKTKLMKLLTRNEQTSRDSISGTTVV
jgi:hypothetical protein